MRGRRSHCVPEIGKRQLQRLLKHRRIDDRYPKHAKNRREEPLRLGVADVLLNQIMNRRHGMSGQ